MIAKCSLLTKIARTTERNSVVNPLRVKFKKTNAYKRLHTRCASTDSREYLSSVSATYEGGPTLFLIYAAIIANACSTFIFYQQFNTKNLF